MGLSFDAYSRPSVTYFPDATEESVVYNPNGTVLYKRTRNVANPSGGDHNDIKFEYDASQRLVRQYEYWTNRSPTVRNDKKTQYDLANRVLCQWMVGATDGCNGASPARVEYAYDKADRLTEEKQDGRAVGYQYDAAGNRTQITWPDTKAATYTYSARHQLGSVSFEAVTLAAYSYDIQGRATGATFGNGNSAGVGHEVDDDLSLLAYALKDEAGVAQALEWTYTYTNAHRLASQSVTVPAHDWSPPANVTTTYTAPSMAPGLPNESANKVDQYEQVAEAVNSGTPTNSSLSYDVRGNLVADGTWTYTYDLENRMLTAAASGTSCSSGCSYTYDPMGRRVSKTVGATVTKFLRAGDHEIAEYDGTNNLLRRYVPDDLPDDFIAWVEGTGTSASNVKWILADRQGSTAVVTDNLGKATQRFVYDEFGNETAGAPGTGFPFRYTGQRFDPETGLYYYKARYYSAKVGRFLQTDPVGYKDGLNLYTYVENDPTNKTDPSGTEASCVSINVDCLHGPQPTQEDIDEFKEASLEFLSFVASLTPIGKGGSVAQRASRYLYTRGFIAYMRYWIRRGGQLVLYHGRPPAVARGGVPYKVPGFFWSKGANMKVLKAAMKEGRPIKDAHVKPNGELADVEKDSVLAEERAHLEKNGWKFNQKTGNWEPPPQPCTGSRIPGNCH